MSNFASQPLTFTPYIPKIDPESYIKVGLQKQAQYDQGVQKIQSAIDNIGGLDILHPEAQMYYKQQYEGVKDKINQLASSDFSNASVVNQVGGIAGSLAKDSNIQNAVLSTMQIRALQKSQQDKKQKGDYAPQAEYVDNKFVNEYLKNNDWQNNQYKGPTVASTYIDHNKELHSYLKDLAPDITYSVNKNGDIIMSTIKSTKLDAIKIRQAIEGFYNDRPQLAQSAMMDAEYTYRDVDSSTLDKTRKLMASNFDISRKEKKAALLEEKKKYSNSPDDIARINNELISLDINYERSIKNLSDDSNVKWNLYNESVIHSAITEFQKLDEIDEKETIAGKNYLDYLKLGLKQRADGSITPLSPADADYSVYQQILRNENKDKGNPGDGIPSSTSHPGQQGFVFDHKRVLDDEQGLKDQIAAETQNLFKSRPGDTNIKDTEKYIAQQEYNLQHGLKVDNDYLVYKNNITPLELKRNALANTLAEATKQAELKNPSSLNQPFEIKGVKDEKGKLYNFVINPKKDKNFLLKLSDINNDLKKLDWQRSFGEGDPFGQSSEEIVLNHYKNDPDYIWLKRLLSQRNKWNEVIQHLDKNSSLQTKEIDNYLATNSIGYDNKEFAFTKKQADDGPYKNYVLQALNENNKGNNKEDIPNAKDITPVGHYVDYSDGKYYITYQVEGSGETKSIYIPGHTGQGEIPGYDQYAWLKQSVDASPDKALKTPLYTSNGKLSWTVAYNHNKKGYKMQIVLPDGTLCDVASDDNIASHPGDFALKAEQLSRNINPYTNKPFTREELTYSLTHTPEEFQIWQKQQQN